MFINKVTRPWGPAVYLFPPRMFGCTFAVSVYKSVSRLDVGTWNVMLNIMYLICRHKDDDGDYYYKIVHVSWKVCIVNILSNFMVHKIPKYQN